LTPSGVNAVAKTSKNKGFLLHGMDEIGAMEFLLDKMKTTKSNDEFFSSMKR
jgi:transcription termination factor Rho